MDKTDLKQAAVMLGGAALGTLIGWALFVESYNVIACGIIGCAIGQFASRWHARRTAQQKS